MRHSGGSLGAALAGQLGPDGLPVVRAKLLSGHDALGSLLNGNAVSSARTATGITMPPLPKLVTVLDASSSAKLCFGHRAVCG